MTAERQTGYDELTAELQQGFSEGDSVFFSPNPAYEQYLQMHKVLLGSRGGEQLEGIYGALKDEWMPRYLNAAGWAAAESSLVRPELPVETRLGLLENGVDAWRRALINQRMLNTTGIELVTEADFPHRMALNVAFSPLLEEVVKGKVTKQTCKLVFEDCLNIAQSNAVNLELCAKESDKRAIAEHKGFGYECNALLAFNFQLSETWFAMPSVGRADSGHHHSEQTHDLMVIHQKWGEILSATPMEIKSAASARERRRYAALLVRGKMHLSEAGKFWPHETLADITEAYEAQNEADREGLLTMASRTIIAMTRDYYQGNRLEHVAGKRTATMFRNNKHVVANHPGLAASRAS